MTQLDLTGPLPEGTTVLEASAGTGKTYALASLTVRYLAEGTATLQEMLLITFSRVATAELRSRIRLRLTEAIAALAGFLARGERSDDDVLAGLCAGSADEVAARLARLHRSMGDFDAATIATTHEFCRRMLLGLGILADHDTSPEFMAEPRRVATEVTADLYLQKYRNSSPPFPYASTWKGQVPADSFVASVVSEPAALVVPFDAPRAAGQRAAFASQARQAVEVRKRQLRIFTYDDQLVRLREALTDPSTGALALDRLRQRFRIVLVDEFQDTDPIQWDILRQTFHGHTTLVLIGDPKQAIYGFRGADIATYQSAVRLAGQRGELTVNYRSDAALVSALDQLFAGAEVGTNIRVSEVTAAHQTRRIRSYRPQFERPVRLRGVSPRHASMSYGEATGVIVKDVVAQVRGLLTAQVSLAVPDGFRPLSPSDIAVLTRTNALGRRIGAALREAGIVAAVSGTDSLYATRAAEEWLCLLRALTQKRGRLVRAAALTSFVGSSLQDLAKSDDRALSDLGEVFQVWAATWEAHGIAGLWQSIVGQPGFAQQVLSGPDGERDLADLRQVSQELKAAETQGWTGQALADWLDRQIGEKPESRRHLASDGLAVHVQTIHKAKGLEYPLVLLPDLCLRFGIPRRDDTIVFHDDQGRRCVDVGGGAAPGRDARMRAARRESDAETLRELYVAMTRAQVGVVAWWMPTKMTTDSPLHRLLCKPEGVAEPASYYGLGDIRADADRPCVTFESVDLRDVPDDAPLPTRDTPAAKLSVRRFTRTVDTSWRRTSYSGITAGAHSSGDMLLDEPVPGDEALDVQADSHSNDVPLSPFAGLPRGPDFGTLVHTVLEDLDFTVPDLDSELRQVADRAISQMAVPVTTDQLTAALRPVVETPLGSLAQGRALSGFSPVDRLNEFDFDLPMHESSSATVSAIADLFDECLGQDDPLRGYGARLRELDGADSPLRGVLTGSIDAVLRLGSQNRFVVVDYKTNQLGDEPQTVDLYHPQALAQAMVDNHYPLQAILYCVALHRYLRWRVPGYDPDTHLGGVGYLFVRGMSGAEQTQPTGVFAWHPPTHLVTSLSDLFAARR